MKLRKIWVHSIFTSPIKAVVPDTNNPTEVQLVGYPYGSYPNGTPMTVPVERQSKRED